MTVVNAFPRRWLRLAGGLGPLQEHAVTGALTITLEEAEEATRLRLVYRVTGRVEGGLEIWAGPVAGVLSQAMERLGAWVTTGSPEAPPSP